MTTRPIPYLPATWLQPVMADGRCVLPSRIVPGPMEGITIGPFCRVLSQRGWARCWISPFLRLSTAVPRENRLRRKLAPFLDTGLPVIAQIMGSDSALLAEAAAVLGDAGVAGVDLNCGCPSRSVIRNRAGGYCLTDPDWIFLTLGRIREACPGLGLSIKIRAGFESPADLPAITRAVAAGKPDFAVMHYRTVAEEYRPVADGWRRLADARALLPDLLLFGSGDLFTPADAAEMYRIAGVDGVAPARGLMQNPRLLLDIEQICRGQNPPEFRPVDQLDFLCHMARESLAAGENRHGLLAEIATAMFAQESALFREITARRDLSELLPFLETCAAGLRAAVK